MKDRLAELRSCQGDNASCLDFDDGIIAYGNPAFREAPAKELDAFFMEISNLSTSLDLLEDVSQDISKRQENVLCSTTKEVICTEKKLLSELKVQYINRAKIIQSRLTKIEQASSVQHMYGEGRIQHCHFNVLARRLNGIMRNHYIKEIEYVSRLKGQIVRQAELAGVALSEEDVIKLVESPAVAQIVGSDIQVLEAQKQLELVQERHQQLLDLEAQIQELNGLFVSMELLVSQQQDIVDNIEHNVLQTVDYVSQSNIHIKKAIQFRKRSRVSALVSAILGLCACCTVGK
uniref:Syntaxin-3-like n=1 Tax=Erpetoichthys calabaricus TaxID=27687 RepID=A0A8C4SWS6_ERPCA